MSRRSPVAKVGPEALRQRAEVAAQHRAVIDQAVGIVMNRSGVTAEEAC